MSYRVKINSIFSSMPVRQHRLSSRIIHKLKWTCFWVMPYEDLSYSIKAPIIPFIAVRNSVRSNLDEDFPCLGFILRNHRKNAGKHYLSPQIKEKPIPSTSKDWIVTIFARSRFTGWGFPASGSTAATQRAACYRLFSFVLEFQFQMNNSNGIISWFVWLWSLWLFLQKEREQGMLCHFSTIDDEYIVMSLIHLWLFHVLKIPQI